MKYCFKMQVKSWKFYLERQLDGETSGLKSCWCNLKIFHHFLYQLVEIWPDDTEIWPVWRKRQARFSCDTDEKLPQACNGGRCSPGSLSEPDNVSSLKERRKMTLKDFLCMALARVFCLQKHCAYSFFPCVFSNLELKVLNCGLRCSTLTPAFSGSYIWSLSVSFQDMYRTHIKGTQCLDGKNGQYFLFVSSIEQKMRDWDF